MYDKIEAIFSIIYPTLLLLLQIAIVIWGYRLGKKYDKGIQGALFAVFLGLIGILITYLVYSNKLKESKYTTSSLDVQHTDSNNIKLISCNHCSQLKPAGLPFCPHCGHKDHSLKKDKEGSNSPNIYWNIKSPSNIKCKYCFSPMPPDARFCPYCGSQKNS